MQNQAAEEACDYANHEPQSKEHPDNTPAPMPTALPGLRALHVLWQESLGALLQREGHEAEHAKH
eukprot:CAMPEP_0180780706 /NCGR_PEP_ID=MMETSP1038_2-20121128/47175_1 /TAXON_ID=632150 /ORGANISM="Azadinium spinosum, Strain 3D9" /LENGTH=64 /DNA_ID=CAMNT_0022816309 /DNA_START=288 /DNA_END=482 /DNA_ORIENTATION=+